MLLSGSKKAGTFGWVLNKSISTASDIIDGCISNDQAMRAEIWKAGLPLEALRSLAMQGSIALARQLLAPIKKRRNVSD